MRFPRSSTGSLRSTRFRSAPFVFLLAASLGTGAACGSGSSKPVSTVVVEGSGDHTDNGVVSVDEAKVRGSIADGSLSVNVPVTSLVNHAASGKLLLHLVSVDGTEELGSVE